MKPYDPRLLACLLPVLAGLPAFAQHSRTISGTAAPLVQIEIIPPQGTRAWSVEEVLSSGAVSMELSDGGVFDPDNGKAKWGPFLDDQPRVLSYVLTGPAGQVSINGLASFDGSSETINTQDVVNLPDPESNFSGWRYLNLQGYLLHSLAADPFSDFDLNGFNLLQDYAFGRFVMGIADGPVLIELPASPGDATRCNVSYFRNRSAADLEFILQRRDSSGNWMPASLENIGITAQEFFVDGTDQVSEIVYPSVPLTEINGTFLRLQARLVEP